MNIMCLDDLPKQKGFGKNEGKILVDWKKSIGCKIKFIYDDIEGVFNIANYITKKQKVIVTYNLQEYGIKTKNILNSNLDIIFNPKRINKFRFNVEEIIETGNSKIKILRQINKKQNNGTSVKSYEYRCLNCGNIDIIPESNILANGGCNVCCIPSRKVVKGINDIATTHIYLAKYFINAEDAYTHTYASNEKILMKCPDCGHTKKMQISNLYNQGFSCDKCNDKISYSEKIMFNVLEQLNTNFETQQIFKWSDNKKYDFYIENIGIIETHGLQHYQETYIGRGKGRSFKDEQENDKLKKELALENGIKEENYIVIDCRKGELEWIKNNIMNSKLQQLLNFKEEDIDWLKCHKYACSSLVKVACDLWNNGVHNISKICEIMKLDRHTIRNYLKQGKKINWCDYDSEKAEESRIKNTKEARSKKVKCITSNKIYNSLIDAENKTKVKYTGISACCNGRQKTAGKLEDGTPLVWKFII